MRFKSVKNIILDNLKTLLIALIIAILVRSLIIQPFYIPSSSMEPTLFVGDRIFVTKYEYGYSKHSFPFSPNISENRFFSKIPKQGDLVVFKTPADNRTDYIKRLIGLPGDEIQFIDGDFLINGKKIKREIVQIDEPIRCGNYIIDTQTFVETLPNGVKYFTSYLKQGTLRNTPKYVVPEGHYFLMGDNRDCSKDSRFLNDVGYIKNLNLVGKAKIVFFSNDTSKGSLLKLWNLHNTFRFNRTFKKL